MERKPFPHENTSIYCEGYNLILGTWVDIFQEKHAKLSKHLKPWSVVQSRK